MNKFIKLTLLSLLVPTFVYSCSDNSSNLRSSDLNQGSPEVNISIDANELGDLIPEDFCGLSVETGSIRKNNAQYNGYFFSGNNKQTLQIFKNLGIRHLRVGGGSVDMNQEEPTFADIDELFSFAQNSGVKIIYSFRLLNGNIEHNVELAQYIWNKYSEYIDCFAIGNEPDWNSYHKEDPEIVDYPTYLNKWKKFAIAIRNVIPEVRFTGPNTGSNFPVTGAKDTNYNGASWTVNFAKDLKSTGLISKLSQHNYVGQDVEALKLTPEQMIQKMLSSSWVDNEYSTLFNATLKPVLDEGLPCRLAESNSFSSGCEIGSTSFATALFSLDYMHWWAKNKCSGVNFHNKQWVLNAPITMDKITGDLLIAPVGYGIAAFGLGGHGYVLPINVNKDKNFNITVYAVRDKNDIYVTLINKEYGDDAIKAAVSISLNRDVQNVETLDLLSPNNRPDCQDAMLGGEKITSVEDWKGKWNLVSDKKMKFEVLPTSALIVKITVR